MSVSPKASGISSAAGCCPPTAGAKLREFKTSDAAKDGGKNNTNNNGTLYFLHDKNIFFEFNALSEKNIPVFFKSSMVGWHKKI